MRNATAPMTHVNEDIRESTDRKVGASGRVSVCECVSAHRTRCTPLSSCKGLHHGRTCLLTGKGKEKGPVRGSARAR